MSRHAHLNWQRLHRHETLLMAGSGALCTGGLITAAQTGHPALWVLLALVPILCLWGVRVPSHEKILNRLTTTDIVHNHPLLPVARGLTRFHSVMTVCVLLSGIGLLGLVSPVLPTFWFLICAAIGLMLLARLGWDTDWKISTFLVDTRFSGTHPKSHTSCQTVPTQNGWLFLNAGAFWAKEAYRILQPTSQTSVHALAEHIVHNLEQANAHPACALVVHIPQTIWEREQIDILGHRDATHVGQNVTQQLREAIEFLETHNIHCSWSWESAHSVALTVEKADHFHAHALYKLKKILKEANQTTPDPPRTTAQEPSG